MNVILQPGQYASPVESRARRIAEAYNQANPWAHTVSSTSLPTVLPLENLNSSRELKSDPYSIASLISVIPDLLVEGATDPGGNSVAGIDKRANGPFRIIGQSNRPLLEIERKEAKEDLQNQLLPILVNHIFGGRISLNNEYGELNSLYQRPITLVTGPSSAGKSNLAMMLAKLAESESPYQISGNSKRILKSEPTSVSVATMDRPSYINEALKYLEETPLTSDNLIIETPPIINPHDVNASIKRALAEKGQADNLSRFPTNARLIHSLTTSLFINGITGATYPLLLSNSDPRDEFPDFKTLRKELDKIENKAAFNTISRHNMLLSFFDLLGTILPEEYKTALAYSTISGTQLRIVPTLSQSILNAGETRSFQTNSTNTWAEMLKNNTLSIISGFNLTKPFKAKQNSRESKILTPWDVYDANEERSKKPFNQIIRMANILRSPNYGHTSAIAMSNALINYANLQTILHKMENPKNRLF